jgi:seryl-tRNA synthetase
MEMLERSVDELKLVTAEVAKQTAQMEEMKNEINAIKSSISSQGPPQENFDEMTTRISELQPSYPTSQSNNW